MRVGTGVDDRSVAGISKAAQRAEELGYGFFSSGESAHNAFLPLVLAAEHTERLELQTSIALAFPRSPMDTAYVAWDLQALSAGRFVLGLGSQVRGHIVRRFGVEWAPPVPRMREYIQALRAIWDCWQNGTRLDFQGRHYQLNLMSPAFNPGPIEHPNVRVYLAAVNTNMLRLAGELCDGVALHPFNTPKYTREVVLPNLERGAARSGRSLRELDIGAGGFIVTGATDEEMAARMGAARSRIAFYASTPSYAPVMSTHGWNDTAEKLHRMSREGRWSEMAGEITDEMLEAFAVVGTHDEIVERVRARHGAYATSISFSIPAHTPDDAERLRAMVAGLRSG